MDIGAAYLSAWSFAPPRSCREMHAAGLFATGSPGALRFASFEVSPPGQIAEGDAFVSELLVGGLVPIGGDRTGDRWCFDRRRRFGGTTPIALCPHDGGGATYVAPSFAAFVYRLLLENLALAHLFEGWGEGREALRAITLHNLKLADRWLLRRWVRRVRAIARGEWPDGEAFDAFMREDPAFARLPEGEFEHFRR
jgi:hypothetical protein